MEVFSLSLSVTLENEPTQTAGGPEVSGRDTRTSCGPRQPTQHVSYISLTVADSCWAKGGLERCEDLLKRQPRSYPLVQRCPVTLPGGDTQTAQGTYIINKNIK